MGKGGVLFCVCLGGGGAWAWATTGLVVWVAVCVRGKDCLVSISITPWRVPSRQPCLCQGAGLGVGLADKSVVVALAHGLLGAPVVAPAPLHAPPSAPHSTPTDPFEALTRCRQVDGWNGWGTWMLVGVGGWVDEW
jgi:hypothetical protein